MIILPPFPSVSLDMSGASAALTDLFTFSHSTPDPHFTFTLSMEQLCTSIQNSRLESSAKIDSLTRFKRLSIFRHEFLLLRISLIPDEGIFIWFRLDRGAKLDGPTPGSSVSQFPACDSVRVVSLICGGLHHPWISQNAKNAFVSLHPLLGHDIPQRSAPFTWDQLSKESGSHFSDRQAHCRRPS